MAAPPLSDQIVPGFAGGGLRASRRPEETALPSTPPSVVLAKHGFRGTILDWNDRVEALTRSYRDLNGGADPTPDLVFDVARSPVTAQDFPRLFAVPRSRGAATARAALPAGYDPFNSYLTELGEATRNGRGPQFLTDNRAFLDTLTPSRRRIVVDLATQASEDDLDWQRAHPQYVNRHKQEQRRVLDNMLTGRIDEHKASRALEDLDLRHNFRRMGLVPAGFKSGPEAIDYVRRGVVQDFWALVHAPYAISAIAQGYGKDWLDTWGQVAQGKIPIGFPQLPYAVVIDPKTGEVDFERAERTERMVELVATEMWKETINPGKYPGTALLNLVLVLGAAGTLGRGVTALSKARMLGKPMPEAILAGVKAARHDRFGTIPYTYGMPEMQQRAAETGRLFNGVVVETPAGALGRVQKIHPDGSATVRVFRDPDAPFTPRPITTHRYAADEVRAPEPYELGMLPGGDYVAHVIAYSNPIVRAVQEKILDRRERATLERQVSGLSPTVAGNLMPSLLYDWWVKALSSETKVGREWSVERGIQHDIRISPALELQRIAGRAPTTVRILNELPDRVKGGLGPVEQDVLLFFQATPDEWRGLYRRRLDAEPDSPLAPNWERMIDRVDAAEAMFEKAWAGKGSERVRELIKRYGDLSAYGDMMALRTGTPELAAASRLSYPRSVVETGKPVPELKPLQAAVTRIERELSQEHRFLKNIEDLTDPPEGLYKGMDVLVDGRRVRLGGVDDEGSLIVLGGRWGTLRQKVDAAKVTPASATAAVPDAARLARIEAALEKTKADLESAREVRMEMGGFEKVVRAATDEEVEAGVAKAGGTVTYWKPPVNRTVEWVLGNGETVKLPLSYVPSRPRKHVPEGKTATKQPSVLSRASGRGLMPPKGLPRYEFTGDAILVGDLAFPTAQLRAEQIGGMVRFLTRWDDYQRSLRVAVREKPTGRYANMYIPIRSETAISDVLRQITSRDPGQLSAEEIAAVIAEHQRDFLDYIYLSESSAKRLHDDWREAHASYEERSLTALDEGEKVPDPPPAQPPVMYVDTRVLGGDPTRLPSPTHLHRGMEIINSPARLLYFYLRPSYALNILGNIGMALFTGVSPLSVTKAAFGHRIYSRDTLIKMDELIGVGKSLSLLDVNVGLRVQRQLAQAWNRVNDLFFRRGALIGYAERAGFKGPEGMARLLAHDADEATVRIRNEVVRRARKSMVDFQNLSWVERNYLRHIIFVYPWISRSFAWSLRSLLEHPVKGALLAEIQNAVDEEFPAYMNTGEWFRKAGFVPTTLDPATGDITPVVNDGGVSLHFGDRTWINPTSVWTFTTLAEAAELGGMLAHGDDFTAPIDFLSPAGFFLSHAVTGRGRFGQRYEGSPLKGAVWDLLNETPLGAAFRRATQDPKSDGKVDPRDWRAFMSAVKQKAGESVLSPGYLDGWGVFLSGGLTPREANAGSLYAKKLDELGEKALPAWKDLAVKMLETQAFILNEPLPADVKAAAEMSVQLDHDRKEWKRKRDEGRGDLFRDITLVKEEATDFFLPWMVEHGLMEQEQAEAFKRNTLPKLGEADQVIAAMTGLFDTGTGKALYRWTQKITDAALFMEPAIVDATYIRLDQLGILDGRRGDYAPLWEKGGQIELKLAAGRAYESYRTRLRAYEGAITTSLDAAEVRSLRREIDDLVIAADKPVVVGGKLTAPSPARLEWAAMTPTAIDNRVRGMVGARLRDLNHLEKHAIGIASTPAMTKAWNWYEDTMARKAEDVRVDEFQEYVVEGAEKKYPGFAREFAFSQLPLVERIRSTPKMASRFQGPYWEQVLDAADRTARKIEILRSEGDGKAVAKMRSFWKEGSDGPTVAGIIRLVKAQSKGDPDLEAFLADLGSYGKGFLGSLIDRG